MATPRRVCCRQTPMPTEGTGARAGVCPGLLDPFLVPRYRAGGQGPHLRATLVEEQPYSAQHLNVVRENILPSSATKLLSADAL